LTTSDSSTVSAPIQSVTDSSICVADDTPGLPTDYYARVSGYASVSSNDGRKVTANPPVVNSSSIVGVSFALIAILAMFF